VRPRVPSSSATSSAGDLSSNRSTLGLTTPMETKIPKLLKIVPSVSLVQRAHSVSMVA
jgi:hypothetical protein